MDSTNTTNFINVLENMLRADSLEKALMLAKITGRRIRGWQDEMVGWHLWVNWHEFEETPGDSEGQGRPGMLESTELERVGHDWVTDNNNNNKSRYKGLTAQWAGGRMKSRASSSIVPQALPLLWVAFYPLNQDMLTLGSGRFQHATITNKNWHK